MNGNDNKLDPEMKEQLSHGLLDMIIGVAGQGLTSAMQNTDSDLKAQRAVADLAINNADPKILNMTKKGMNKDEYAMNEMIVNALSTLDPDTRQFMVDKAKKASQPVQRLGTTKPAAQPPASGYTPRNLSAEVQEKMATERQKYYSDPTRRTGTPDSQKKVRQFTIGTKRIAYNQGYQDVKGTKPPKSLEIARQNLDFAKTHGAPPEEIAQLRNNIRDLQGKLPPEPPSIEDKLNERIATLKMMIPSASPAEKEVLFDILNELEGDQPTYEEELLGIMREYPKGTPEHAQALGLYSDKKAAGKRTIVTNADTGERTVVDYATYEEIPLLARAGTKTKDASTRTMGGPDYEKYDREIASNTNFPPGMSTEEKQKLLPFREWEGYGDKKKEILNNFGGAESLVSGISFDSEDAVRFISMFADHLISDTSYFYMAGRSGVMEMSAKILSVTDSVKPEVGRMFIKEIGNFYETSKKYENSSIEDKKAWSDVAIPILITRLREFASANEELDDPKLYSDYIKLREINLMTHDDAMTQLMGQSRY